jgi:hypothetical protein
MDWVALGFVGACAVFLAAAFRDLVPIPPDGYYHVMVARRIVEDRAIPLWDWWEFAPSGRPHLYPPFFHLLIALFSLPFGGDVFLGFRVMTVLLLPAVLLGEWYFVRTLFGSRWALFAVLLTGWDPMFVLMALMGLPSILAGGLAAVAFARFYERKFVSAGALLFGVMAMHPGIGPCTAGGMLAFALWDGRYRKAGMWTVVVAALVASPWYLRLWAYRSWHVHPLEQGIYGEFEGWALVWEKFAWLQFLNVVMVGLAIWGMRRARWGESRNRLLLCAIAMYLPLLLSYGGRFYLHAVPFLAVFAAEPLSRMKWPKSSWSGVARLAALALCPTLVIVGTGTVVRPGPLPMVSGWTLPVFLGFGGARLLDGGAALGLPRYEDVKALAEHVRSETKPGQVLHVNGGGRDFALMVGALADRPIDEGAWEEYTPPGARSEASLEASATDPAGYYVGMSARGIPRGVVSERVGRFWVGKRG